MRGVTAPCLTMTGRERRNVRMSEVKKDIIERMATKFTAVESPEAKGYIVMCMTAYEAGKEAGKEEERERWEKQVASA